MVVLPVTLLAAGSQLLGWNNLGMHCMDSDYSVFSILPPYNTIEAQLIVGGKLVTNGSGYTVTYQAVVDASGSLNSTAMGKGNYYSYATALYGAVLGPEGGLAGWNMPGTNNTPQGMLFEATIPTIMTTPMSDMTFRVVPVIQRIRATPARPVGTASRMISGSKKDSNWATRIR